MKVNNLILSAVLSFLTFSAYADWGPNNYTITKLSGSSEPVISSPLHGSWTGMIGVEEWMPTAKTHELVFEFDSPNYFSSSNQGHFAVGVRSSYSSNDLEGRGVIIGNVSAYPNGVPCDSTSATNTIAIEHFLGAAGNCVYGSLTQGPALLNNQRYRVQLISDYVPVQSLPDLTVTTYKIWKKSGSSWFLKSSHSVTENVVGPTYMAGGNLSSPPLVPPLNSMGVFFTEVFSTHSWTLNIYNMTSNTCTSSVCTNL